MSNITPIQPAKPPTVLGIDPGLSTGIALAHHDTHSYYYISATCSTPEQVWDYIVRGVDVVVIERFHASLISRFGLHTVEVVGGVIALCWKQGIPVVRDTPTQRKPYLPMARRLVPVREDLSQHELRHEIDAMAHVVRYLFQAGYISQNELRIESGD